MALFTLVGCSNNNNESDTQGGSPQENLNIAFDLKTALNNKEFEKFYTLMSRATHNIYEYSKGMENRPMYQKADIASLVELLPHIPQNALNAVFAFRAGMSSQDFTIADFIIRRVNGSEDEKIALLKQLQARGLSFKMLHSGYPDAVFYPLKDEKYPNAISYIDLLKKNPEEYRKIIDFLKNTPTKP